MGNQEISSQTREENPNIHINEHPLFPTSNSDATALLRAIHTSLTTQNTPLEFLYYSAFQTTCVIIAFLFGVFSIFSWRGQKIGNNQSLHANQLTIIALCLTSNSTEIQSTCLSLTPKISTTFAYIAAESFGDPSLRKGVSWPWRQSYYDALNDPTGLIVMIVIPVIVSLICGYGTWRIYREKF